MALTHILLQAMSEADLRSLIEGAAAESLTIEYKRDTYGGDDRSKAEFLADVSSLANTLGGDLIIGIDAPGGVPTALSPFTGDADVERLRFEQMARSGLEPRIPNLQTRAVPVQGGFVLVLRVPRSYVRPHRIIFGGRNRFVARSSAGKYDPNVAELRALFASGPDMAERMRAFRFDRTSRVVAGETVVPLLDSCFLVLHLVPFSHFAMPPAFSLTEVTHDLFAPIGTSHAADWRVNFDGFLTLSNENQGRHRAYVQVFRTGAVEAVAASIARSDGGIHIGHVGHYVVDYTRRLAVDLQSCGVEPPLAVMASLIGVRGRLLASEFSVWDQEGQTADRDELHLTEVVLEEICNSNPDCAKVLRPTLNHLANAAGLIVSPFFDQDGNYAPR